MPRSSASLRRSAERTDLVHITLLGDSIFDNAAYTGAEPDVVTQLRALLPAGARATLLAVDGAITRSMTEQIPRDPRRRDAPGGVDWRE